MSSDLTDLRSADALARERALDVAGSFIVQAPAGAGKTELLTRRFLALLPAVAEPESILAITFTRKAAAEMRERILGALRAVSHPDPQRPVEERTLELARAALDADERRGWNLLGRPGRLRIQTIDSLNLGLARRLPVLSGLGAALGVEEDARDLYRRAAERLLNHLPQGAPRHREAVATLLDHLDNRVDLFVELVIEMLARREAWLPVLPGDVDTPAAEASLRGALESSRESLVRGHLVALRAACREDLLREASAVAAEAAAQLAGTGDASALSAWLDAAGTPAAEIQSVPRSSIEASASRRRWCGIPTHSACFARCAICRPCITTPRNGASCSPSSASCGSPPPSSSSCSPRAASRTTRDSPSLPDRLSEVPMHRPTPRWHWTPSCATCSSTSSRTPPRPRSGFSRRSPQAGSPTTVARCSSSAIRCSRSTASETPRSVCSSTSGRGGLPTSRSNP